MTTIAPPAVREFDPTSLEKIAYGSVKTIPTREPNDQYRLGYSVWMFLKDRKGTLAQAVKNAGARLLIPETEAVAVIERALHDAGYGLP